MTNLTLFRYSLTLDNREWRNYAFRFFLVAAVFFTLFQFQGGVLPTAGLKTATGLKFFTFLAHLNLVFISLVGVCLFSSAITEEKEASALSLLLMTGLTPLTLMLSKSSSKLILGIMLLMAQLPFTILAATLGGIGERQILACYATFLIYLFYVCNLSLFSSVVCRRAGRAVSLTFLLLFAGSFVNWGWLRLSPFARVNAILSTGFAGGVFGGQCASSLIGGAVFFLAALALFNHFTRESPDPGTEAVFSLEAARKLAWFKPGRARPSVFTWKDFHFTAGGRAAVWARIVLFAGISVALIALIVTERFPAEAAGDLIMAAALLVMILDVIVFSSRVLRREIAAHTLPLLALIPVEFKTIFREKYRGVFPVLAPSAFYLAFGYLAETLAEGFSIGWTLGIVAISLNLIFFNYLILYSSLAFKTGGAAMAVGMYLLCVFVFGVCGMLAVVLGPFFLHKLIIRKLRDAAWQ